LKKAKLLQDATTILTALGMPRAQQNDRSALTLLALLDLKPGRDTWAGADNARLLRIRDVLDFCRTVFKLPYAENTRETFRRQTMHQLVEAGVALYNPDDPGRAVNSPHNCYQVSPEALAVIRSLWNSTVVRQGRELSGIKGKTCAAQCQGPQSGQGAGHDCRWPEDHAWSRRA
jgi:adenine-specific DNA-methyltransferase